MFWKAECMWLLGYSVVAVFIQIVGVAFGIGGWGTWVVILVAMGVGWKAGNDTQKHYLQRNAKREKQEQKQ